MQLDNENQINQSDICAWSTMGARTFCAHLLELLFCGQVSIRHSSLDGAWKCENQLFSLCGDVHLFFI